MNNQNKIIIIELILILVLIVGFFLQYLAYQQDLKEITKYATECNKALNQARNGLLPLNEAYTTNTTLNITLMMNP